MISHSTFNNSRGVITLTSLLSVIIFFTGTCAYSKITYNKLTPTLMQKWIGKHPHDMILPEMVTKLRKDFAKKYPQELKNINQLRKKFNPKMLLIPKGKKSKKYYVENMDKIRRFCGLMQRFAQAYLVTDDKDFANQAKSILLYITTLPPDAGGGLRGCDEIPMSIMQLGPRTYDWIYDILTPLERKKIQECFRERGKRMWKHIGEGKTVSKESHRGRMLGFMGEAGIVFWGEIPEASTWAVKITDLIAGAYPRWGGDDGGWAEGPGYWSWYIGYIIPFLDSLYTIVGYNKTIDKAFFKNTTYFGIYCSPLSLPRAPFGDSAERNSRYAKRPNALYFGRLYRNPYFIWYANQYKGRTTFLEILNQLGKRSKPVKAKSPAKLTQSKLFDDIGWAAMHSNLAQPEKDIFLLFKSSPYGAQSHSHADQNSFTLSAFNMPLTIASGYYNCYGSPHHYGWTRSTKANNTILVNNQGQHSRRGKANIDTFLTDGQGNGITYALGNAKGVYQGKLSRALRHVIKLDAATFVLIDELSAPEPATFSWLLHSLKKMSLQQESHSIELQNGSAKCNIDLNSSQGLKFSQNDKFDPPPTMAGAFKTRKKKKCPNEWHFRADTTRKSRDCIISARIKVYEKNTPPTPIKNEKFEDGKDQISISWQQNGKQTNIILDKTNRRLKAIVIEKDKIDRYIMLNDKIMYHKKQMLINATSLVNISATYINDKIYIGLGKGRKDCTIKLKILKKGSSKKFNFRPRGSNKWQKLNFKIQDDFIIFKHPGQDGEAIFLN
jgi:Heparinase II/III-like protein/Domain of unknown function (DUF4962)